MSRRRGSTARRTGGSSLHHVAPNILPLSFLYGSIAIGWAILTEASISFLGFGDPEPDQLGLHAAGRLREPGAGAAGLLLVRAPGPRDHPRRVGRASSSRAATRTRSSPSWADERDAPLRPRSVDRLQGRHGRDHAPSTAPASRCPQGAIVGLVGESRLRQDHDGARRDAGHRGQRPHRGRTRCCSTARTSSQLSERRMNRHRWRDIAFIPQRAMNSLDPGLPGGDPAARGAARPRRHVEGGGEGAGGGAVRDGGPGGRPAARLPAPVLRRDAPAGGHRAGARAGARSWSSRTSR